MTADLVNMAMNDLARRFGNWLGIEPDDVENAEPVATDTRSHVVLHVGAPVGAPDAEIVREPACATTVVVDHEVAELRRLVSDLRSGLDLPYEA